MAQLRLLYLDGSQLSASLWQAGTLTEEGRFTQDDAGYAAFAEYLARHQGSIYRILANVSDEGFQLETLPHTLGADRSALLTRKLGQHFFGSPLSTAISYGREKTGRKDEQFLLAALTRPQLFEPWLAALQAAEAQLAGIWSLPLAGATLLARLLPGRPDVLLVSLTRGGIRQSFFQDGRLKFSRLSHTPATSTAQLAAAFAAEAGRTYQYLLGQRLIARGTPLPVLALVHPAQAGVFAEHCKSTDELQITLQDTHAAARALKLKTLPQDMLSEPLYLHLLALGAPREQFAPPAARRFWRLGQTRGWLVKGGALALAGCLLFAGREFVDLLKTRNETATLRQSAETDARSYQAIQQTFPPMPTTTENLRAVINRFDDLEKRSAPLAASWLAISHALDAVPRIEIERIEWQLGARPVEAPAAAAARPAPTPVAAGNPAGADNALYASALVHGVLPAALASDQRGQIELVNTFADALRKEDGLQVSVQRMPFDIEPGKSLKSANEAGQTENRLKFIIQLSRKL